MPAGILTPTGSLLFIPLTATASGVRSALFEYNALFDVAKIFVQCNNNNNHKNCQEVMRYG
ncbi:unnamed protein product [marine sediment metagenome]|uniref:Uncharacterized protein n=1 Tax=marine sediment metagenome TaxID=412755 RepID=X1E2B9_9ZZZZ